MSIHQDNFKNNLKLQLDNDPQLNGLDAFKKSLEKDYFSEVTIRNCSSDGSVGSLVIEMKCNIELVEVLFHYQKGTWGNKRRTRGSTTNNNNSFSRMFSKLKKVNSLPIDVEELSIFLNDSSIIIKKIYDQSVGEEFGTIIDVVAENYYLVWCLNIENAFVGDNCSRCHQKCHHQKGDQWFNLTMSVRMILVCWSLRIFQTK
jgi:hypothetical protein